MGTRLGVPETTAFRAGGSYFQIPRSLSFSRNGLSLMQAINGFSTAEQIPRESFSGKWQMRGTGDGLPETKLARAFTPRRRMGRI